MRLSYISTSLAIMSAGIIFACSEKETTPEPQRAPDNEKAARGGKNAAYYLTGNSGDVSRNTTPGTVLMGGGPDVTEAIEWMISRSGGGDFVVLRSSGSDGYNDWIYYDLGGVHSVETLVVTSRTQADDVNVESIVRNAEAIFIAGGDQFDYVSYWKNTRLESAINYVRNTKGAPVGGTSAGLAILGEYYYGASNGTVYSNEALDDPYDYYMAGIGGSDFLNIPYLENTITDTHYNERDRQGRHFTFMARLVEDFGVNYGSVRGIGVDEATAACVDQYGRAYVYGDGDVYFLQGYGGSPETCNPGTRLTWNRGGQAVDAYVVPGTANGSNYFSLSNWSSGSGGYWEYWYAYNGSFTRN